MRVVVAPDSFKGSATATDAANAIARGWALTRPDDVVIILPQADGGEGTLDALAGAIDGSHLRSVGDVVGPDGRPVDGAWLELPDGSAVVELAALCGLPLYDPKDPLGASTHPLGEVLARLRERPSLTVALGGSASTDGGSGALVALGIALLDENGDELPPGGGALTHLATIDRSRLVAPPTGGVRLLTDVVVPLLGPSGAAAMYGPQKGASAADVEQLEHALTTFSNALGGDVSAAGAGAAGGTAYGLAAGWGATIASGAATVAELTGLVPAIARADILITGEGQFDETSAHGKAVGHALELPHPSAATRFVIAGRLAHEPADAIGISLERLAGSAAAAMADPLRWLEVAGELAASRV